MVCYYIMDLALEGHCTSFKDFRTVKIQSSMRHFYWMNSVINVTCGMIGPAVKLEHCVWYVNDAKVSSERFHHQTSSAYEFSIEGTKCSVAVVKLILLKFSNYCINKNIVKDGFYCRQWKMDLSSLFRWLCGP